MQLFSLHFQTYPQKIFRMNYFYSFHDYNHYMNMPIFRGHRGLTVSEHDGENHILIICITYSTHF